MGINFIALMKNDKRGIYYRGPIKKITKIIEKKLKNICFPNLDIFLIPNNILG